MMPQTDIQIRAQAEKERRRRRALQGLALEPWNDERWHQERYPYRNRDSGKVYQPHHKDEARFVYSDGPWKYGLCKGGEGSGKSAAGIIKDLERLRRGMSGIMVSPDLPHFKKSLWPEFKRWCPVDAVIASQRYRLNAAWEPAAPFTLTFVNGAQLVCGGIDDPTSFEGPNVSFVHFDEAHRKDKPTALKVLTGRVRILGPHGEQPQLWLTAIPIKHWLFDYFGDWEKPNEPDPLANFKARSLVVTLLTMDNEAAGNVAPGYTADRATPLTEEEAKVRLGAEWGDLTEGDPFLPTMVWWEACQEQLPPLARTDTIVLAADAGVSNDSFALIGASRHPRRPPDVAVRYARVWTPTTGHEVDFEEIEEEIVRLCRFCSVVQLAYDPYQLHHMMGRLGRRRIVWCQPFGQQAERLMADKQLLDLIMQRRIAHDGDAELTQHLKNANKQVESDPLGRDNKLRIVKRMPSLKIDLAVGLSMAADRCLKLPMKPRQSSDDEIPAAGARRW